MKYIGPTRPANVCTGGVRGRTHRVVSECVVQGVAWKDVGAVVDLVQSYHQAGASASAHVSSTERLHESEVERRSPILHFMEVWVHLENLSTVQHFSL